MIKAILKNKTIKGLISNTILFMIILFVCCLEGIINVVVDSMPTVLYFPMIIVLLFLIIKMFASMFNE